MLQHLVARLPHWLKSRSPRGPEQTRPARTGSQNARHTSYSTPAAPSLSSSRPTRWSWGPSSRRSPSPVQSARPQRSGTDAKCYKRKRSQEPESGGLSGPHAAGRTRRRPPNSESGRSPDAEGRTKQSTQRRQDRSCGVCRNDRPDTTP